MKKYMFLFLILAAFSVSFTACGDDDDADDDDEFVPADFSECDPEPLNNQEVVCNDLKQSIEEYCGFDLTVEPCACAEELTGCTEDKKWLQDILDCRTDSVDCSGYIACLGTIPESDDGCSSPFDWQCLTAK